ncbi:MAG: MarR family transcriptional regulator [Woeseiaceae bacterium]|nr:MarR family transcriptional regulator [Woeseiaceae bacterium]
MILETFSLNGALLSAGDQLVKDIGLTSARWQVLGAVALEERPLTVAQIARRMGLSRQAVQRLVNELAAGGVLMLRENPDHKRAKLVALTKRGEVAYAEADERQVEWSNGLAVGISQRDIENALTVLQSINTRLQQDANEEGAG